MSAVQPSRSAFDVERIRGDFPILSTVLHGDKPLAYLDNAASTQRPRQVIQTLVDVYEKHYANVHRGIHALSERSTGLYEETREAVRRFINARTVREIMFTSGTTAAVNLVARSWGDTHLTAGNEVLLTEMEHHSNIVPWHQLAERTGCRVRFIPVTGNGLLDLDAMDELLGERTKLVALASVSNVLGTRNPVREVVRRAHEAGARVLVDAAQSVPHEPTDVQADGADFVAFSGHKMLGPSGVGVLYGREELLESMPPFLGGGSMIRRVRLDGFEPDELPAKFEAGTPPIAPAIGLGAAVEYLEQIGMDAVRAHEGRLTARAHEVLDETEGVRILGPPPENRAGIVSFTIDRIHAHDAAQVLDRYGVAVRAGHHCTMPLHKKLGITASTRASFSVYNTFDEIEQFGRALHELKRLFRQA